MFYQNVNCAAGISVTQGTPRGGYTVGLVPRVCVCVCVCVIVALNRTD